MLPDDIMQEFENAVSVANIDAAKDCLWNVISDILGSVALAAGHGSTVHCAVSDYVSNHYGE